MNVLFLRPLIFTFYLLINVSLLKKPTEVEASEQKVHTYLHKRVERRVQNLYLRFLRLIFSRPLFLHFVTKHQKNNW